MSDWWSKALAKNPTEPTARPAVAPVRRSVDVAIPQQAAQSPRSRRLSDDSEHCPECDSGNYGGAQATRNGISMKRCYDCGFPLQQSGSGVQVVTPTGETQKANQVASEGFHPNVIVGRV